MRSSNTQQVKHSSDTDDEELNTNSSRLYQTVHVSGSAKQTKQGKDLQGLEEILGSAPPEKEKVKYSHPNKAENVPFKYMWVQKLPEFEFLEKGNLQRAISNPNDPNHIYFVAGQLFIRKLDLTLTRVKSYRNLKELKFKSTAETTILLGSEEFCTDMKSILYKIIPTAIRTFISEIRSFRKLHTCNALFSFSHNNKWHANITSLRFLFFLYTFTCRQN